MTLTTQLAQQCLEALETVIQCDDDAKRAHGNPRANLNGYGLVDLFDIAGHPFGVGKHKVSPCRSNHLDVALSDARKAITALREALASGEGDEARDERSAFEAHAVKAWCNDSDLERGRLTGYRDPSLNAYWVGWKARAAMKGNGNA